MSLLMDLGILNLLINGKSWSNLYVYHAEDAIWFRKYYYII